MIELGVLPMLALVAHAQIMSIASVCVMVDAIPSVIMSGYHFPKSVHSDAGDEAPSVADTGEGFRTVFANCQEALDVLGRAGTIPDWDQQVDVMSTLHNCLCALRKLQNEMGEERMAKLGLRVHWIESMNEKDVDEEDGVDDGEDASVATTTNYSALEYALPYLLRDTKQILVLVSAKLNRLRQLLRLPALPKITPGLEVHCRSLEKMLEEMTYILAMPEHLCRPNKFLRQSVVELEDQDHVQFQVYVRKLASKFQIMKCAASQAVRLSHPVLRTLTMLVSVPYYQLCKQLTQLRSKTIDANLDLRLQKYLCNLSELRLTRSVSRFPETDLTQSFLIKPDDIDVGSAHPPVKVRFLSHRYSDEVAKLLRGMRAGAEVARPLACYQNPPTYSPLGSAGAATVPLRPLILHFHGGGFVGQSSFSHQRYTRCWANSYPKAIDDAWIVYRWLMLYGKRVLGIDPSRIIVAGDSAGGNIAAALTLRVIQEMQQGTASQPMWKPAGVFLAYAALSLDKTRFYPSLLRSFEDFIISYKFLTCCVDAYVPGDADPCKDPLLSPVVADHALLEKFPPTRMVVGSMDPLLDHSLDFANRLEQRGRPVKLEVFRGVGHAFFSLQNQLGPVGRTVAQRSIQLLKELIDYSVVDVHVLQ